MQPNTYPSQNWTPPPAPPRKRRRTGLTIALIIVGTVVTCCGAGAIMVGSRATNTTSGDTTGAASAAATKTMPGLRTTVKDGRFAFVVDSVQCGAPKAGSGYLTATAQGQYCLVKLTVRNVGDKPQTFFVDNQKAKAGGRVYSADSKATAYAGGDAWVSEINPGNQIDGKIVFDMPRGVQPEVLVLHDSAFSGGVQVRVA